MDFQSEVQDVNEVTKRLKVLIPAELVNQEFDTALSDLAKTATVKGFRAGKAPIQMIEQAHGSRLRMEVANRLISNSLRDAIGKMSIDMVGSPEIDVSSFEPGKQIEYTAEISLFPSPTIVGYDKFDVSVPKLEVTDEQISNALEEIRRGNATQKKIELRDVIREGDVIDVSVSVTVEGETQSRPEPAVVALGEGTLPPDVEAGLIGLEVTQKREIESVIGDTHPNRNMRGKKAVYSITLNAIYERVLPELNDEFAKKAGFEVETMIELKKKIQGYLEENTKRESRNFTQVAILKKLLELNQFLVPQVIVDDQLRSMLVQSGALDTSKVDPDKIPVEPFREKLGPAALERVRSTIIIDRIAESEKLTATDEEIEKSIGETAERYGVTAADARKFFREDNRMVGLALDITRGKVLDMLISRATVTYEDPAPAESSRGKQGSAGQSENQ